ncbi:MAG: hypothetical protein QOI12_4899 [Alphaproteobacteria bacterium]|jgi:uncharacterized protein (DUF488 family)|nr:hypothetical protein [Alphaproteobacteria bacterium]
MTAFDLLTIGHSNHPAERFLTLLRDAGVTAIADVRSVPSSRRFPWFSGKALAERLPRDAIAYLPFGEALGGRPRDPALYCDGIADYEAMAATPQFRAALDGVVAGEGRVCLMCAEREPLDCHRCLLVARAFAERGLSIGHILADGTIEPQAAIEDRLLALAAKADRQADLFRDRGARLADAYRRRARAVAARLKA